MQLDDLLSRYFYDTDVSSVTPDTLATGIERCLVDLGLEQDRGKHWPMGLAHMLGSAPDLEVAFEDDDDREAARNFMDLLARGEGDAKSEDTLDLRVTFMPNRIPLGFPCEPVWTQVTSGAATCSFRPCCPLRHCRRRPS